MPRRTRSELLGKRYQREQDARANELQGLRRELREEWRAQGRPARNPSKWRAT